MAVDGCFVWDVFYHQTAPSEAAAVFWVVLKYWCGCLFGGLGSGFYQVKIPYGEAVPAVGTDLTPAALAVKVLYGEVIPAVQHVVADVIVASGYVVPLDDGKKIVDLYDCSLHGLLGASGVDAFLWVVIAAAVSYDGFYAVVKV